MSKILESRRYQTRAQEAFPHWFNDANSPLATIILPTGTGKTYTAALCLKSVPNLKILWTAHREELIDQAKEALNHVLPSHSLSVEMADRKADPKSDIVVGSVQTVSRNRKHLDGFEPDIVVIDEYHHYSEDNIQYDGLLKRWPKAKVMGLTATPWRFSGDNLPLGKVLIQMDIGTAVDKKYLVPPKAESLITGVSLAEVKTRMGDFATKDLSKAVNIDSRNKMIAKRLIELVRDGKRQGILFAVDVDHSKAMHALLKNEVRAAEVYGETPIEERRRLMSQIRNGEIDVLCNNLVCLDDQTEILTKTGWVGINEISSSHDVANWDNGKIWFESPKNIIIRDRTPDEQMVVLETRRRSIRVTDKHKLLYKSSPLNAWSKTEAINLCDKRTFVPVSGNSEPDVIKHQIKSQVNSTKLSRRITANAYVLRKKDKNLSILQSRELATQRIKERDELVNKLPEYLSIAECKFIGFWTGDGTKNKLKSGGIEYKITQSEANSNIIEWFDKLIYNLGYDVIRKEKIGITNKRKDPHTTVSWSFSRGAGFGSQKRKGLYEIEPYLDKNGSDLLWALNERQFQAFIEGYWLADGNHKDGSDMSCLIIHGANITLFNKLQALAVCRGYRCSIKQYDNHGNTLHLLSLTKTSHHQMTKHKLQIESGWKLEKVWCVTTSSGNIITRRKGTVTIMGNCTEGFDVRHLSFIGQARPTKSLGLYTQMIGRGLRTCPEKDKTDCIIVDVHDKIKVKQSRVTFFDMAAAGDLYGDKKRATNVLKAEIPVEDEISQRLKNFPIMINKNKIDRWTTDDEAFSVSSWDVGSDQWIVTWTSETKQPKIIQKRVFVPWTELPSNDIEMRGREIQHPTFGQGKVIKITDRDNPKILVEFSWGNQKLMEMTSLNVQKFVKEYSPSEIETTKVDKLFYLCLPGSQELGRVIHFIREGKDLILKDDKRLTKVEADAYLQGQAMNDGILQLVRTNAKWKFGPASDKQKSYVEGMSNRIGFDIDIDTLTKGDASAIIEQAKWQEIIHRKFGTNYKEKLLGYSIENDDV